MLAALTLAACDATPVGDTWSTFATVITQPLRVGARELVVQDCRGIEVGAVEHDHRVFPAEFENDSLQSTARLTKDVLPCLSTTGEHDQVNR